MNKEKLDICVPDEEEIEDRDADEELRSDYYAVGEWTKALAFLPILMFALVFGPRLVAEYGVLGLLYTIILLGILIGMLWGMGVLAVLVMRVGGKK